MLFSATLPTSILPPRAVTKPPSKETLPPIKPMVRLSPILNPIVKSSNRSSGVPLSSKVLARLTISPGLSRKPKPIGSLTVSIGCAEESLALNCISSGNKILSAVLPINEPPTSSLAFSPKIIPAGLTKNRLALPFALIAPSMFDILPPVTREKIFSIACALLKKASFPVPTEKS